MKARFVLWLAAVAVLGVVFALRVLPRLEVETDITAMLPQVAPDPALEDVLKRFADRAGRQTLFLVSAHAFEPARQAAQALAAVLREAPAFASVRLELRADGEALDRLYLPHRAGLLSDRHHRWLEAGESERLREDALRALYTPSGLVRARPFAEDPLNLYGDFLAQQAPAPGALQLRGGVLGAQHEGRDHVLVRAELSGSPFSIALQREAETAILAAIGAARGAVPEVEVLSSGVIRHAQANSARASAEISVFGSLSMAGVVLLLWLSFHSLRPLVLAVVSLGIGAMASVTLCALVFERVHLLALVFGCSLIGVAVDYAIHFFADQFRDPADWNGAAALAHVGPAIGLGMLTTALGYLTFLLPPFPGLRQMALFSVTGIGAAGITVLCAFPLLAGGASRSGAPAVLAWTQRLAALPRPRLPMPALALLLALCAAGLARLSFVDDVRALQSSPAELLEQERRVREVLGGGMDTRFFLVEGDDAERLLQAEEALRERLDGLVERRALSGYSAISRAVPSQARQARNRQLLADAVYASDGILPALLGEVGFDAVAATAQRTAFLRTAEAPLSIGAWLDSEASRPYRALWLGAIGQGGSGGVASAVSLSGVADLAALRAAAQGLPGVRLVDRVADISAVLAHYRRVALAGLVLALGAIGTVLALRYGPRDAARQLLAPLGGCVLTLALLGLFGVSANLFNVLALLLVLGLGVDYTVFLREGAATRSVSLLAISLAGCTTLLSFGMLAASATPFIRSLGLSVLVGVSLTWLLALLVSAPARSDN